MNATSTFGPFVEDPVWRAVVIALAYAVVLAGSSLVVRAIIRPPRTAPPPPTPETLARHTPLVVGDKKDAPVVIYSGSVTVTSSPDAPDAGPATLGRSEIDTGRIIGKCENILVVTLVLFNQFPALAIIFAAKGIVRQRDITRDPNYYLGGTLVNFTWSVLVAGIARTICFGLH